MSSLIFEYFHSDHHPSDQDKWDTNEQLHAPSAIITLYASGVQHIKGKQLPLLERSDEQYFAHTTAKHPSPLWPRCNRINGVKTWRKFYLPFYTPVFVQSKYPLRIANSSPEP